MSLQLDKRKGIAEDAGTANQLQYNTTDDTCCIRAYYPE